MRFYYVAEADGQAKVSGELEAQTRLEALRRLAEQGWRVLYCDIRPPSERRAEQFRGERPQRVFPLLLLLRPWPAHLATLYHQLGQLLGAGVSMQEAVARLAQQAPSVYLRLAMAEVLPAIQAGESLTQNLALYPQLFPPEAIGLLRAAERSGDWEGICSELERWYSGIYRGLLWCIVSRIYYACVFALLLIVPYLPYIISRGARWYLVFALTHVLPVLGGVFLVWLAWRIAAGLPRSRPLRDRLVLAVPLARGLEMHNASARFLRALASLVHAGVAAADALELAGEATGNCVLAAQVKQAAEAVRRGSSVEEIALRLNFLDRQQRNVLATAFAAGRLDQGLTHLAAQASEAATSRAQFARLSIQGMLFLLAAVATGAALVIGYLNYLRSVAEAAGATDLLDELFKH